MQNLHILNSKETKALISEIEEHYGCHLEINGALLRSPKDKVYLISRDFGRIDCSKLRINNLGVYFCTLEKDGIRLTIEGAQLIKPQRNFVEVSKEDAMRWARGEDIPAAGEVSGYVVVMHGKDILGCGRFKEGKVLNYVPNDRRIKGNVIPE